MLDLVKYKWRNSHGAWIGPNWKTLLHENHDPLTMRVSLSAGKPGMTGHEIIDRLPIPEEMRLTGLTSSLAAYVVLYSPKSERRSLDITCKEFLALMQRLLDECPMSIGYPNNTTDRAREKNYALIKEVLAR